MAVLHEVAPRENHEFISHNGHKGERHLKESILRLLVEWQASSKCGGNLNHLQLIAKHQMKDFNRALLIIGNVERP